MQDNIQPELIEKYQLLLDKDPKSQVFAPLTEAYRKMGLLEEAFRIAVRGVQFNPNFSGGRIALAKVFLERDNLSAALDELEKSVELSSDNILAHQLLAECYLRVKRPKEALKSFKMVLYLAPTNEKAGKAVKKLEALTADEYDDDLFEMRALGDMDGPRTEESGSLKPLAPMALSGDLERSLSLIDAYIVRNDIDKAVATLNETQLHFGQHPELMKRLNLVNQRSQENTDSKVKADDRLPNRKDEALDRKIRVLRNLLSHIRERSTFT
jgi:tetratricopeptide (TPR) repeat protein